MPRPRRTLPDLLAAAGVTGGARLGTLRGVLRQPDRRRGRAARGSTGELRSHARANILPGVISVRAHLKQAMGRAERRVERYAEPLAALFHDPCRAAVPGHGLDPADRRELPRLGDRLRLRRDRRAGGRPTGRGGPARAGGLRPGRGTAGRRRAARRAAAVQPDARRPGPPWSAWTSRRPRTRGRPGRRRRPGPRPGPGPGPDAARGRPGARGRAAGGARPGARARAVRAGDHRLVGVARRRHPHLRGGPARRPDLRRRGRAPGARRRGRPRPVAGADRRRPAADRRRAGRGAGARPRPRYARWPCRRTARRRGRTPPRRSPAPPPRRRP